MLNVSKDKRFTIRKTIVHEALEKLGEIAGQLNSLYEGESLLIVAVEKGVICLIADLLRRIDGPNEIECMRCVQYGKRDNLRNSVKIYGLDGHSLEGRLAVEIV
jgi:hypoxanthine-guanine phosphoribosyltransferase